MMGYRMMCGSGPFHWLCFIVVVAVVLYPTGRILSRMGFSPLRSVLAFVPILNLVALWILAFTDWPVRRTDRAKTARRQQTTAAALMRISENSVT